MLQVRSVCNCTAAKPLLRPEKEEAAGEAASFGRLLVRGLSQRPPLLCSKSGPRAATHSATERTLMIPSTSFVALHQMP